MSGRKPPPAAGPHGAVLPDGPPDTYIYPGKGRKADADEASLADPLYRLRLHGHRDALLRGEPIAPSLRAAALQAVEKEWAQKQPHELGRPPGLTTITDDEQLRAPICEMRRDRVRTLQRSVAPRAGFTIWEICGYLKATHRTWAEFLRTF